MELIIECLFCLYIIVSSAVGLYCKLVKIIVNNLRFEPSHDKLYELACSPSEDSGQPGRKIPPRLTRFYAVRCIGSQGPAINELRSGFLSHMLLVLS